MKKPDERTCRAWPIGGATCLLVGTLVVVMGGVSSAKAETVSVDFSSSREVVAARIESSEMVLNTTLGYAHPPLQAAEWDEDLIAPRQSFTYSLGDGQHGSFNPDTYANFHEGVWTGGPVIEINTDTFRELQFTDFTLAAGYILRPKGSRPLEIRSQSYIRVLGQIDCAGTAGTSQSLTLNSPRSGGVGRCGGGNGGRGGSYDVDGVTLLPAVGGSTSSSGNAGAGLPGTLEGEGGGGGGGMSQIQPPPRNDGYDITDGATLGNGGGNDQDDAFRRTGGGAGGAGGVLYENAGDVLNHSTGGGGGGGGGVVHLFALTEVSVAASGSILASGGAGGGVIGTGKGGGGGGGGGGSIQIFSRGDIRLDGTVTADGGAGGASDGGNGGIGGAGRTWIIDSDGVAGGGVVESPTTILPFVGVVNYRQGSYTIVSKTFDLENSNPELSAARVDATVPAGNSLSLYVATSEGLFEAQDANWIAVDTDAADGGASALSSASGGRYLRFQFVVSNADVDNPVLLRSVSIDYNLRDQGKFEFSGCGVMHPPRVRGGGLTSPWTLTLLLLPLLLITSLRRRADR